MRRVIYWFYLAAVPFLVFLAVVTGMDVVGRFFGKPLPGALEMCELALAAVIFLTWSYTQAERGHVSIDIVVSHFPRRVQLFLDACMAILGLIVAGLLAWQALPAAMNARVHGDWTPNLYIPLYPFIFLIFVGALVLAFQFILDIVHYCRQFGGQTLGHRNT